MISKCPVCRKSFEDVSESWRVVMACPKCGLTREDAQRMVDVRKVEPAPEVKEEYQLAPDEAWVKGLAEHILEEYGYSCVRVGFNNGTSFYERKGSLERPTRCRIRFSYRDIDFIKEKGFQEYVTQAGVWGLPYKVCRRRDYWTGRTHSWAEFSGSGRESLWMLVLHELAHALVDQSGGSIRGVSHGAAWRGYVRELVILFPFEEVRGL